VRYGIATEQAENDLDDEHARAKGEAEEKDVGHWVLTSSRRVLR
jgi:hypothetical protein